MSGFSSPGLRPANNLSDIASAATSRTNLGVYSISETDDAIADASITPGATNVDLLSDSKAAGTLVSQKKEYLALAGSATTTILDYTGEGYVSTLFIGFTYAAQASIDDGLIKVYIDGSGTADISVTMGEFFNSRYIIGGTAPNRKYFNNRFFAANTDFSTNAGFVLKLPIPFATQVKIDIVNGSGSAATLWTVATINSGLPNTWSRTRRLKAASALIDAPSSNTHQQLVNIVGKGRLVGIWMLQDDFPHSVSPLGATWEGNFRFYIDNATKAWAAGTAFSNGDIIIDSNGHKQTVTSAGTSAGSQPTWSQVSGATTADNTVTWTQTPGTPNQVWLASKAYALHMSVLDSNGYVQRVTTAGTSAGSIPSFNATPGGTTTDNTVTWTNQGNTYVQAAYQSPGTEDYFLMSLYGAGVEGMSSGDGTFGTTFCNASPLGSTAVTRSMYRYHVHDPIVFDSSLVVHWQVSDTSQVSYSGSPKIWVTVYYYTEA